MSAHLLTISIGNTRTSAGIFSSGKLGAADRWSNEAPGEMIGAIEQMFVASADVYLCSVNDRFAQTLIPRIESALGCDVRRMERDVPIPIGRQLDPEAIVGEDRLLNAAAAFHTYRQACAVIDAGTAVTVDFIDGEGTFHGGAILPGVRMQLRALHEHTAQLPNVEFAVPNEPIGHNTVEAIRTGVFHGVRGEVRELVEKYAELYAGYPKIVATGGDAETLFKGYDLIEAIVPDLTLEGMMIAHRHVMQTGG